ncbi:MAG: hypothetical protein CMI08_17355 [Oceanospirillaceae bacterium]|uniref:hypothetical protein n=1 Tax=unclassified Thalassolituus TaxID=2624967 RepID=UPI000C408E32|nr:MULTISPECIES: hypothetical protein [unclassified Thalassolituus]MAS26591.1 hypothetical protein [Oceanospirillaceae bacterium]MAY00936.1 hypothetical protein [Oceanospirillaceae bacterium]MBL34186.1 hypothetical protein [Oceanospirillaceae bacterium]MBS52081.1 hypothetical protein [Oceanospirillaceae bacterium]|tara:strand:+ start:814 stop:1014 length:201 start_codon:yes stop_codon:yes gene_type:complete
MALYFIDTEKKGDAGHQVHREGCAHLPEKDKLYFVGSFATAKAAYDVSPLIYSPASYCPECSGKAA